VLPILVGGLLVLWSPPPLPAWGFDGLLNQVLFVAHVPSGWGTISPGPIGGPALALRWGFEYLLLGVFAVLAAAFPRLTFTPLRWSTPRVDPARSASMLSGPNEAPAVDAIAPASTARGP
jgi:hypothetical protein